MEGTAVAAAVEQTNRFASMFKYTQKSYWGGPWYPYWTLILLTIVGGFFGLDHFWLRSPTTGILKLLFNILGLGIWYIYDMLQIIGDQKNVMEFGLSAPIVGPLGIGAGMFVDNQPNQPTSKSPLRFLAYLVLVCLPFGFDFFIAGDKNGGFARFITSLIFFLWPIGFIWGTVNMFKAFLMPTSIFEKGTTRLFPMSWFMEPNGPSVLGPKDVSGYDPTCGGGGGLINVIMALLPEIVQKAVMGAFPQLKVAADSAATAVQAGATAATAAAGTVKVAANTATALIDAAKGPAVAAVGVASGLAQQLPAVAAGAPGIAAAVGSQLQQQATAELAGAASGAITNTVAANPALATGLATGSALGSLSKGMTGGGYTEGDGYASTALFVLMVGVLAGGAYMGFKRLNGTLPFFKSKKNGGSDISSGKGQERDDTPPQPSGL